MLLSYFYINVLIFENPISQDLSNYYSLYRSMFSDLVVFVSSLSDGIHKHA